MLARLEGKPVPDSFGTVGVLTVMITSPTGASVMS